MLKRSIDLLLYSNIFIALCAVAFVWTSELMVYKQVVVSPYVGFVFFASLCVYSIHRLVGVHKLQKQELSVRHNTILSMEWLVILMGGVGAVGSMFFMFGLSTMQQVLLIFPSVISLAYIIPFSRKGRRLRDYPFIKIFLIAITWAWVSVIVPIWELQIDGLWWLFFERFFFILAITLPFDIRDIELDRRHQTKTLPLLLGTRRTKRLSFLMLGISLIIGIIYLLFFSLQYQVLNGYLLAGLYTFYFLNKVRKGASDYLFTGWLDGTMIIQYFILYTNLFFLNTYL